MDNATLAREVAKYLVRSAIALKTAELTAATIADHTHFDQDDMVVKLGAGAVGMVVSTKLKPVTDKMVDTTADRLTEQWNKRRTKKNAKKTEI